MERPPSPDAATLTDCLQTLGRLHRSVDELASRLQQQHGAGLACKRGCSRCCVDELTVFTLEAEWLARHHPELAELRPHPDGACALLSDEGDCRVYAHRPYVCRTQGLPLRWVQEEAPGEWVESRDLCELSDVGDLTALAPEAMWTLGPAEALLAQLQQRAYGDESRVPLRSLVGPAQASPPRGDSP